MWDVRIKINVKEMDNTPKNRRGFQESESFPILYLGKGVAYMWLILNKG